MSVIVNSVAAISWGAFCHYSYDGATFAYNGTDGNHFAITFQDGGVVGVLFEHESERSPFNPDRAYDAREFFRGMPAERQPLADRSLGFWREEGSDVLFATAAVWDQGPLLAAADPWPVVWEHGGSLLRIHIIEDHEVALAAWQEDFGLLSEEEVAFARSLFRRRIDSPGTLIVVESDDPLFRKAFPEYEPEDEVLPRQYLAFLGIYLPEAGREDRES